MQLSIEQLRSASVFTVMLLIASAGHVAVGVTYIQYGQYISDFGSSSLYKEVLPFSSLAIVTGGLVFLYVILANMSLRGTNSSFLLTTASWNLCWLMTGLSFAVTVIAALVFAKFTVIIRDNGISFSDLPDKVAAVYWCSLADGAVGLLLGLPSGFKMMGLQNEHRLDEGSTMPTRETEMHPNKTNPPQWH